MFYFFRKRQQPKNNFSNIASEDSDEEIKKRYQIPLEFWISLDQENKQVFFSIYDDMTILSDRKNSKLSEKELNEIERSIKIYNIQKLNLYEQRKEHNLPRMTLYESITLYSAIRKVVSNKI
jgi:hypothetical protein